MTSDLKAAVADQIDEFEFDSTAPLPLAVRMQPVIVEHLKEPDAIAPDWQDHKEALELIPFSFKLATYD